MSLLTIFGFLAIVAAFMFVPDILKAARCSPRRARGVRCPHPLHRAPHLSRWERMASLQSNARWGAEIEQYVTKEGITR